MAEGLAIRLRLWVTDKVLVRIMDNNLLKFNDTQGVIQVGREAMAIPKDHNLINPHKTWELLVVLQIKIK